MTSKQELSQRDVIITFIDLKLNRKILTKISSCIHHLDYSSNDFRFESIHPSDNGIFHSLCFQDADRAKLQSELTMLRMRCAKAEYKLVSIQEMRVRITVFKPFHRLVVKSFS